jgi:predicted nucleic acid-binding protein
MRFICDTNVIVGYLMQDSEDLLAKAFEIFEQALSGKITLIVEQAVFTEVIFVLSSLYSVPKCGIPNQL